MKVEELQNMIRSWTNDDYGTDINDVAWFIAMEEASCLVDYSRKDLAGLFMYGVPTYKNNRAEMNSWLRNELDNVVDEGFGRDELKRRLQERIEKFYGE